MAVNPAWRPWCFLAVLLGTIAGLERFADQKTLSNGQFASIQSPMNLNNAIGQVGTVYLTIRAGGSGNVR
jgi:hypothetical protein